MKKKFDYDERFHLTQATKQSEFTTTKQKYEGNREAFREKLMAIYNDDFDFVKKKY